MIINSSLFSIACDLNCILFSIACDWYFGTNWRVFLQTNFAILGRQSWCAMKIGNFSENKQSFKSKRHGHLLHAHLQFSNTIRHGPCTDCQQRLLLVFRVFTCIFCVTFMPTPRVFRRGRVFVLPAINFFGQSTSYFFKVR